MKKLILIIILSFSIVPLHVYGNKIIKLNFAGVLLEKETSSDGTYSGNLANLVKRLAGPSIRVTEKNSSKLLDTWNSFSKRDRRYLSYYSDRSRYREKVMTLVSQAPGNLVMVVAGASFSEGKLSRAALIIYDKKNNTFYVNKRISSHSLEKELRTGIASLARDHNYFSRGTGRDRGPILFAASRHWASSQDAATNIKAIHSATRKEFTTLSRNRKLFNDSPAAYYLTLDTSISATELYKLMKQYTNIAGMLYLHAYKSDSTYTIVGQFFHRNSQQHVADTVTFTSPNMIPTASRTLALRFFTTISTAMGWESGTEKPPLLINDYSRISTSQYHYLYDLALQDNNLFIATLGSYIKLSQDNGLSLVPVKAETLSKGSEYTPFNGIAVTPGGTISLYNNVNRTVAFLDKNNAVTKTISLNSMPTYTASSSDGTLYLASFEQNQTHVSVVKPNGSLQEYKVPGIARAIAAQDKKFYMVQANGTGYSLFVYTSNMHKVEERPLPLQAVTAIPSDIAVDSKEVLYLLDVRKSKLYAISPQGTIKWVMNPAEHSSRKSLSYQAFIVTDKPGENIYIADSLNKRVLHLGTMNRKTVRTLAGIKKLYKKNKRAALASAYSSLSNKNNKGELYFFLAGHYAATGFNLLALNFYNQALSAGFTNQSLVQKKIIDTKTGILYRQALEAKKRYDTTLKETGPESAKKYYQDAIELFEKILKVNPGHAMARKHYRAMKQSTGSNEEVHISFNSLSLEPVYAAMYKYYADNSLGQCTIKNISQKTINRVQLTLLFKGYMDYPTESRSIRNLEPGETRNIKLYSVFNNSILSITEDTPASAQVRVEYQVDGSKGSLTRLVKTKIYNRNALTWDNTAKLAAFVTHRDPAVKNYARTVVNRFRNMKLNFLNENLQRAIQVFDSLGSYGMTYVRDPKSPYDKLSSKEDITDYVQFPRETLKYKSGDCDDLTVLYASLLEHLGIDTAFVTVPGHIFLAVNTGVPASRWKHISIDQDQLLFHRGMVWIPVEVTALGDNFTSAWHKGSRQVKTFLPKGKIEVIETSPSWKDFYPVTLPASNWEARVPTLDATVRLYNRDINTIIQRELKGRLSILNNRLRQDHGNIKVMNSIGVTYARFGKYTMAEKHFRKVLAKEAGNAYALTNMGNLAMIQGKNQVAIDFFNRARKVAGDRDFIMVNLVTLYEKNGETRKALSAYRTLASSNKALASTIAPPGSSNGRASNKGKNNQPYWAED